MILTYLSALITTPTAEDVTKAKILLYDSENHVFSAEIYGNDDSLSDNLRIVCMKGCARKTILEERFLDEPLGIFRSGGEENIVYITSSSGSGYQIRAYEFNASGIQRVLSESASATPRLIAFDGKEAVEIFLRDYSAPGFHYDRKIFVWNQSKFEVVK